MAVRFPSAAATLKFLAAALFVFPNTLSAWPVPPRLKPEKTRRPPRVDGKLYDPVWATAPSTEIRFQTLPNPGARASERTLVKVVYDDQALYVAFYCFDRKAASVRAVRGERDQIPESDSVVIMLDPFHDHRSGYYFAVNAAGTVADGLISNDSAIDLAWDEVWTAEVSRDRKGWYAEFRIPWSTLRFPHGQKKMTWGAQFRRYISRLKETDDWSPVPSGSGRLASIFGHLTGIGKMKHRLKLLIRPYLLLSGQVHRSSDSLNPRRPFWYSTGVDIKYGLTSALTLDLAINPDFAQVELDAAIVNLSRYEVQLPEKRPFFLEGAENFKTPLILLYTRRIGAAPPTPDPTHPSGTIEELDPVAPIWTALKLTGRPAPHWSMGFLSAFVGPTRAAEGLPDGRLKIFNATELTHFAAARVRRHFARASAVGLMLTAAQAPDTADAYVTSLDVDVRDMGPYLLTAQAVNSLSGKDPKPGYGLYLGGGRKAAAGFRWNLGLLSFSKHLQLNRTGFLSRPDYHEGSIWTGYVTPRPSRLHRQLQVLLGAWSAINHRRMNVSRGIWFWFYHYFVNTWYLQYDINITMPHYDDYNTYSEVAHLVPYEYRFYLSAGTDTRKFLFANLASYWGWRTDRSHRSYAYGALTLRIGKAVHLSAAATYRAYRKWAQWVQTVERDGAELPVYGPMDMDQIDLTLRATVSIRNTLAFQVYSQYLHAAAEYPDDGYYLLRTPQRAEHIRRASADWDRDVFKIHGRVRWEYRPGCRLYLVYSHQTALSGSEGLFSMEDSWNRLGWETADDIVMVKLDYEWRN